MMELEKAKSRILEQIFANLKMISNKAKMQKHTG